MAVNKDSNNKKPKVAKAKPAISKAKGAAGNDKGDTAEIIRSYLYGMREAGMMAVPEKDVLDRTGYARTDSSGYRKVMKALTKELCHVEKSNGSLSLTKEGLQFIADHGVKVKVSAPTMEENQAKLQATLLQHAKAPETAVLAIWNLLLDGKSHAQADLLAAAGYKRPDSTGYREVMKWLKKLELVEKEGKSWKFTDKVYRHGSRPN